MIHYTAPATAACLGPAARVDAHGVLHWRGIDVAFYATHRRAEEVAQMSGGPGDPYGYRAVGNAALQWPSRAEPRLRVVVRCLR